MQHGELSLLTRLSIDLLTRKPWKYCSEGALNLAACPRTVDNSNLKKKIG